MRFLTSIFLFFQVALFGIQTDFDVAVVGTSPISMLEAIYHLARNERVLIIEADERCGGAWKSINVCGVAADLGCHQIGSDRKIKEFFEKYFGCRFICLDHPDHEAEDAHAHCSKGFYFSGGCQELISHLTEKLHSYSNVQMIHQNLNSVFVDTVNGFVELSIGGIRYTTEKLKITSKSHFCVNNPGFINNDFSTRYYHHLYILAEDTAPYSFTYLPGMVAGVSRIMNLTPFLQLPSENLQLIVFQVNAEKHLHEMQQFFEILKVRGLLTAEAKILDSATYTYHQSCMNISMLQNLAGSLVEVLDTSSFGCMVRQLEKWQSVLSP